MAHKISRSNLLVRVAYFYSGNLRNLEFQPKPIGICRLVWKAAVSLIVSAFLILFFGFLLLAIVAGAARAIMSVTMADIYDFGHFLLVGAEWFIGIVVGIVAFACVCGAYLWARKQTRELWEPLAVYVKARKERVCPIYTIE